MKERIVTFARSYGFSASDDLVLRLRHLSRVALAGLSGFVIQSVIFELLGIRLGLVQASTAALIGGEAGVLTCFVLNNHFNFNNRSADPLWRRLIIFHFVISGSLFVQWGLVSLAETFTEASPTLLRGAFILGVAIGFCLNYVGYHLFVWRSRAPTTE